jgi:opacity protein-like surface antigen
LGYNWQFAPTWVVGLEGDWSWTNNSTSESVNTRTSAGVAFVPASPAVMSRDLDWLASIRGRLGFLVTPDLLLYGTGGAAFGHVNYTGTLSSVPPGTVWAVDFDKNRIRMGCWRWSGVALDLKFAGKSRIPILSAAGSNRDRDRKPE